MRMCYGGAVDQRTASETTMEKCRRSVPSYQTLSDAIGPTTPGPQSRRVRSWGGESQLLEGGLRVSLCAPLIRADPIRGLSVAALGLRTKESKDDVRRYDF